jgi:hypothetical protein
LCQTSGFLLEFWLATRRSACFCTANQHAWVPSGILRVSPVHPSVGPHYLHNQQLNRRLGGAVLRPDVWLPLNVWLGPEIRMFLRRKPARMRAFQHSARPAGSRFKGEKPDGASMDRGDRREPHTFTLTILTAAAYRAQPPTRNPTLTGRTRRTPQRSHSCVEFGLGS